MKNEIKLDNQKSLNITFIILTVIILALVIFSLLTAKDIKSLSNEIYQAQYDLEKEYYSSFSIKKDNETLAAHKPRLQNVAESFISVENTLDFIHDLETEAESLNIDQTINIPEVNANDEITPSAFQVNIIGTPENVFTYLNRLDRKPYYINVNNLKLTNNNLGAPGTGSGNISLTINGLIYWKQ